MPYLIFLLIAILPQLQTDPWYDNYNAAHNVYEHYKREKPLLIVFYADWCGPCKMLKAEFHKLKPEQLHNQYICVRVNIDDPTNKYLINHTTESFPKLWPKGVRIPATVVIGADQAGARLGFMNVKEIIKALMEIEIEGLKRKKAKEKPPITETQTPVTQYYTPSYIPRYTPSYAPSRGCPTCY